MSEGVLLILPKPIKLRTQVGGFTLLEVMVALAIIAVSLVSVIAAQSQSVQLISRGADINILTELARSKMAQLELDFQKRGFGEIPEKGEGGFENESYADYRWRYEVSPLQLPATAATTNSQQQGPVGFGYIKDFLARSIRQLSLTVLWQRGERVQELRLVTFLASSRELPNLNLGQPSTGQQTTSSEPKTNEGTPP